MILQCPNKSSESWVSLVNKVGELQAYKEYIKNGNEIPTLDQVDYLESISELKDEVSLKEQQDIVDSLTSAVLTNYSDVLATSPISIEQAINDTIDGLEGLASEYLAEGNTVMSDRITRLISRLNETTEFTGYKNLIKDRISALKFKVIEDPEFDDTSTSGEVYDKGNLERDPEDRMSAKTKRFLTFIPIIDDNGNTEANYLGLEKYYEFDSLYKGLLSNTSNMSGEDIMEIFKSLAETNNMYKSFLFKFNELSLSEKNSIVSVLTKQSVETKLIRFWPADKQGRVSLDIINSNQSKAEDALIEEWNNNFSSLINKKIGSESLFEQKKDDTGFIYYNINNKAGKLLSNAFDVASKQFLTAKTEEDKLKAIEVMSTLFNEIGISLDPKSLYSILDATKLGFVKATGKTQKERQANILENELRYIFEGLSTQVDLKKTPDEDSNNIFNTQTARLRALAQTNLKFNPVKQTGSFTNGEGNTVYPFVERHYLNSAFAEVKNINSALHQSLLQDNFSKDSLWLNNSYKLNIYYVDSLKNSKKKNRFGKTYENLSDKERILTRYALFQNSGKTEAMYIYSTPSDKTTFPVIGSDRVKVEYTGKPSIETINEESQAFKELYKIANSELLRVNRTILEIQYNKPEGKIEGYHTQEKTGKRFFFFIGLNDVFSSNIESENIILETKETKDLIIEEIKKHLTNQYNKEKAKLISEDIVNEGFTETLFDKSYMSKIREGSIQDQINQAIIDYLVNDMIALANIYQVFTGDPALLAKTLADKKITKTENSFYKENLKKDLSELEAKEKAKADKNKWILDNTIVNVFKRIAKDIAPGREGVFTTSTYNTIFIHEPMSSSSIHSKYKEYVNLDAADAQEWVTIEEYLDTLYAYGEVTNDKYNTIKEKLKNQEELTEEELGLVLQPIKPVYTWRQAKGNNDPLLLTYYIKTSAFPLLPQLVKGTQLENLYKIMNDNNIQRAVVKSGVKAGFSDAMNVFEAEGLVRSVEDLQAQLEANPNTIKTLNRKGFRIQQDVPYDEFKNSILLGTQLSKLIFANLNPKWDFNGKKSYELKDEFDKLISQLTDIKYQKFLEAYDIKPTMEGFEIGNLDKFIESLKKLAIQKGFNYNDLLQLKTVEKNGRKVFEINPFFSTKYKEVESLFTSMVSNEIMKRKLSGRSYVQGSSVGFVNQREQGIKKIIGDKNIKDIGGITFTNDWKGNLDYRIDENGGIFAEILVAFNFFDSKGNSISIEQFIKKDGTLDMTKFDSDLLESIGYRIPTQGHMSMVKMKIVGFLPKTSGDLMIVPAAITKQMGSDFDVDKVYNHTFNHELVNGKLKKIDYTEGSNNEEAIQNRVVEIFKNIIENPNVARFVAKTLSSDPLKDAVEDVRGMKGISSESHLGLLDRQFNDSQVSVNRDGKVMIGISSLASTHHSLAQYANLYLAKSEEFSPIMFSDENGLVYTDVAEGNNVNEYKGYQGSPEVGAWRLDKVFGFNGVPILDTIAYIQTAATDNAKDPILGKGNINKHTANVALLIARSGFNEDWISNFMMQYALVTLSKRFDSQLDDITDMSYTPNKREAIVEALKNELETKYLQLGGKRENIGFKIFKLSELKSLNEESANKATKERNYYLNQLQVLASFEMWNNTAKELGKIQNALNFETKGLGKDLYGVTRKLQLLNQTDIIPKEEPLFINANKLIDGTFIGNILDKGVRFAETLYNNSELFPYRNPIINDLYDSIKQNSNRKNLDVLSEDFADTINEHIRFSIFSKLAERLDERPIEDVRTSLIFGKEALGNRIITLKQEFQDEPNSPGFDFLNKLNISKPRNSQDPILVSYPNSLKVSDSVSLLNSLGWLDLYNNPHTNKIAVDLVKYSYAIGNERSINDFGRFLPYDIMKDLGIIDTLNSINYHDFGIFRDNFITQFFQHAPEFAPQFSNDDVTFAEGDKNTFTIKDELLQKYEASRDEEGQINTSIILTKYEKGEGRGKSKIVVYLRLGNGYTYTKIDKLGDTGINEYNLMLSYGKSFLPQNQVKTSLVKPATIKPVEPIVKKELPALELSNKVNIYAGTNENADLSNFAIRPFVIGGDEFKSVEQYFQYQKWNYLKEDITESDFKENQKIADSIMSTTNGGTLKFLGKKFKAFDNISWDKNTSKEMKVAIKASFEQNPKSLERLLSTGNSELTHTQDNSKWGKEFPRLLMEVRSELLGTSNKANIEGILQSIAANGEYQGLASHILETNKDFLSNIDIKYGKIENGARGRTAYPNNSLEYTPENITFLKDNEIFVFGSNAEGVHGKGAALLAKQKFGAKQGQSNGFQGQSYAVVTKKNWRIEKSSSLEEIQFGLRKMLLDAKSLPNKKFLVTKLGSSLAGYKVEEIKSLFENLKDLIPNNVILSKEYEVRQNANSKILITIDEEHPGNMSEEGFREVFMHEIMHALTKYKVETYYSGKTEELSNQDIEAIKQLEQVVKQLDSVLNKAKVNDKRIVEKLHNITNQQIFNVKDRMPKAVKELIAYSFTDKDIKAFLNSHKGLDQKKSLWERFKGIILKILGLRDVNQDSLLANTALAVLDLSSDPSIGQSNIIDYEKDNLQSQTYSSERDLFERYVKGLIPAGMSSPFKWYNNGVVIVDGREKMAYSMLDRMNKPFSQFGKMFTIKQETIPNPVSVRNKVSILNINKNVLNTYNNHITGLFSDYLVSSQLTKFEKSIEQLKAQIKVLEKRKAEGKSDYAEVNTKIDAIKAKISAIEGKYNDTILFKQAKGQISEVAQNIRSIDLQLSEDMSQAELMKSMNILQDSYNAVEGWLSVDEFMDYSQGSIEKKTWNNIKSDLNDLRKEYLTVLERAYIKFNKEVLKRNEGQSELFQSTFDINALNRELLDPSASDIKLLQSVYEAVNRSRYTRDQELIEKEKKINETFKKLESITGKKGSSASDLFLQKDKNGKWTGGFTLQFSKEFYDTKSKLYNEAKDTNSWREYYSFIKKNTHIMTKADFNSKSNTNFTAEDYEKQASMLERYSNREAAEKEKIESLKEQAQFELESEQINQEELDKKVQELDKELSSWIAKNSPYAFWDAQGKRSTKGMFGSKYILTKPIKKWEDSNYNKIKSNSALLVVYKDIKDLLYENNRNIPKKAYGMLPELRQTIVEKMKQDGTMSLLGHMSDWMKDLVSEDIASARESDIRIGNNVIKNIPVSMMSNSLAIEEKTRDLKAILMAHTAVSLHHKHMSQVQPITNAAEQLLKEIAAQKEVGGKRVVNIFGSQVELKGGLENARNQLEYFIDTQLYKRSKNQEAVSSKKTLSVKDKKIIKELDEKLKKGDISQEDYDKIIANLGQNITGSKIGDTIISLNYLQALALNPISAAVNGTFAIVTNFTHSAGRVDFDTPSAMKALGIVMSSLSQTVAKDKLKMAQAEKLYAWASKLGIMHDVSEGSLAKNIVDKVMKMQSKSEFIGNAQSMAATLMYQKLKDKNGKDISIWDAYKVVKDEIVWDTEKMGEFVEPNINELYSKDRNGVNMFKLHSRITQMNKYLHGNYRDPVRLKKSILGRAVMLFRTWIPMTMAERFGKEYFDDSLGRLKKGRYRTIGTIWGQEKAFKTITRILKGQLLLNNTQGLTEVDAENLRKVNAEIRSIVFLTAIALMLKSAMTDDDEEKEYYLLALNMVNRTYGDITFFVNPNSTNQILRNAIPAFKTLANTIDVITAIPGLFNDTDEYKTGFRKGKSKIIKEFNEVIPIVNQWDKIISSSNYLYENIK